MRGIGPPPWGTQSTGIRCALVDVGAMGEMVEAMRTDSLSKPLTPAFEDYFTAARLLEVASVLLGLPRHAGLRYIVMQCSNGVKPSNSICC